MSEEPKDIATFNGLQYVHHLNAKPNINYMLWVLPPEHLNMAAVAAAQMCRMDDQGRWWFIDKAANMYIGPTPDSPLIFVTRYPWEQLQSQEYTIHGVETPEDILYLKLSIERCAAEYVSQIAPTDCV